MIENQVISCVSIQIQNESVVIPDLMIKEIFSSASTSLAPFDNAMILGMLNWRSIILPVIDLDFFMSQKPSEVVGKVLIIVRSFFQDSFHFYGVKGLEIPKVVRMQSKLKTDFHTRKENPYVFSLIDQEDEQYLLPNLQLIESEILKLKHID